MSKTSQCIELLKILYSRNHVVGTTEIADLLETNPRNIPEYVRELREIGYDIKTIPGRYGGYLLERCSTFPVIKLTEAERDGLMEGYNYLLARNDFMNRAEYCKAMAKIGAAAICRDPQIENMTVLQRFPLAMPQAELEERYKTIGECIKDEVVLSIEYRSNDNIVRRRCIHPYKLYMYNNAWFVLAYCESVEAMRYFKINRIISFSKQNRRFRKLRSFSEGEWLDLYGMRRNGEWYDVKLKFTRKHAMYTQDYLYGKDQKIECVDQNTTIFTLKMQYRDNIIGFVLSHSGYCEVLEPDWLKQEVRAACERIIAQQDGEKDQP